MLTHIKKKRQENKARVKQIKNKKQTNRKPNLSWKINLDVPPHSTYSLVKPYKNIGGNKKKYQRCDIILELKLCLRYDLIQPKSHPEAHRGSAAVVIGYLTEEQRVNTGILNARPRLLFGHSHCLLFNIEFFVGILQ